MVWGRHDTRRMTVAYTSMAWSAFCLAMRRLGLGLGSGHLKGRRLCIHVATTCSSGHADGGATYIYTYT
jgi:hypothetical protein